MFGRILIANRGEIAVRILRTCREMDIETVAIYSESDREALHVQLATTSICVGESKASASYLNLQNILSAAWLTGCDAIHAGFGFLSENSEFARMCEKCGLVFIGPSGDVMDLMGNKASARAQMIECGVPVVKGSDGIVNTAQEALKIAETIGYPILVKASAGGGGRGMRIAQSKEELPSAFEMARAEAISCFGDGEIYLEQLIQNPKHIEVQILADSHGNVIHLGERDCSVQRRNQKLVEEAPCATLTPELRQKMGEDAVRAAKAVGYCNAGTIEYVLDAKGNYYFIEMNTRIQVEHPVTEMLTGLDLIEEQIRIAFGEKLRYKQEDITLQGHAIECRINGEDPWNNFLPNAGIIEFMHLPAGKGVRVDTGLYHGYEVSPFYDSMLGKVIVHAPTREQAIAKMRRALEELVIKGVETNRQLSHRILFHQKFIEGSYHTGFIEAELATLLNLES
ncbi:MAG: acetyl-CoA carboxylase biotin carboxylase subunit [Eubacteriales bacterium]